jgi:hypothetical protein
MHPIHPRKQGVGQVRKRNMTFRKYKYRYNTVTKHFPKTTVIAFTDTLLTAAYQFDIIFRDSYSFSSLRNFNIYKITCTYRPIQPL